MKYTFKITEDKAETKEVSAMSFKKALKPLITANPKWNGIIDKRARNFQNRNLYEYVNSLRDKKLSQSQLDSLRLIGLKTSLLRKSNSNSN